MAAPVSAQWSNVMSPRSGAEVLDDFVEMDDPADGSVAAAGAV